MSVKGINLKGWIIFVIAVLIPAGVVGFSNKEIFPGMWEIMTALLVITVGAAALTHDMADEPDTTLRQFGLVAVVALGAVLYLNCISHVTYRREIEASGQGVQELHAEQDRQNKLAEDAARRQVELANAEKARLDAQRRVLVQLPTSQRRNVPLTSALPSTNPAQPEPAPQILEASAPKETPAQIRDKWNPRLLWLLVIETGMAILGLLVLFAVRHWDGDENGVPDWLQRVAAQMSRLEFAQSYPKDFAKYGPKLYPNA